MTLFWQFEAWWGALESARESLPPAREQARHNKPSWATFFRAWQCKWQGVLKFRQSCQHKECDICYTLRERLRLPLLSQQKKLETAIELREHLQSQYHDRLLYWSLRWVSRLSSSNTLVVIIDGMDKVKTAWPKWEGPRKPAFLDGLIRPRCVLSAVICHGWYTGLYLCDEQVHHGASHFCDFSLLRSPAGPPATPRAPSPAPRR